MTTDDEPNPYESPPEMETSVAKPGVPASYLLVASISFVVIAVGLVMFGMPGLAVFLVGALVPVSLRTVAAARKRQAAGQPTDWADYIAAFLASVGIFALCLVVGSATFCCTCLATVLSASAISGDNYGILMLLAGISAIVGLVIGIWMFSRYWPRN
ncbi:MAG: hypothetical protein U0795_20935 [Pirellulales bacterium]